MSDMLAVYDFAVSRISFDFFTYLALADLARREAGADRLYLLTVPADGDGFHPNVQYDLDQKRWRDWADAFGRLIQSLPLAADEY